MSLILPFEQIIEKDRPRVGGKAYALSVMAKTGAKVPSGVCIIADAYRRYVSQQALRNRSDWSSAANASLICDGKRSGILRSGSGISF